jgi:hypothetical protein
MEQRWRQRNATVIADGVPCNVWGMGRAQQMMKRARATQQLNNNQQQCVCMCECRQSWCMVAVVCCSWWWPSQQRTKKTRIKRNKTIKSQYNNRKSAAKSNMTNALLKKTTLPRRCSTFKWERWSKDDDNAMQPSSPMELSAMYEGWGVHNRWWKERAPRNN